MDNKLPYNWTFSKLTSLVIYRKGVKPEVLHKSKEKGFIPYLDIKAIEKGIIDSYVNEVENIKVNKEDILVVWDGARSGWVGTDKVGIAGSTIMVLTPVLINHKFLYRYLQSKYTHLQSNTKGSGIPHVNGEIFWNLQIPIPPLNEQDRIVIKLEKIINHIEVSQKSLTRALESNHEYTQSIYRSAINGILSKKWRNKNKTLKSKGDFFGGTSLNINKQFKSNKNLALPEIPETWSIVSLGKITSFIGSGTTPSGGDINYLKEGIPFLRSQNIQSGEIITENIAYISSQLHNEMARSKVKEGDVLLNITGSSIGRSAVIPKKFGEGNVNQHVCIIRLLNGINPDYISLYLNSPYGQQIIMQMQKGTTRQGLNFSQIFSIPIILPPISEQNYIVNYCKKKIKDNNEQERHIRNSIKEINTLLSSTLTKAFTGSFVPQNKQDEPGWELLIKIKNERENMIIKISEKIKKMRTNRTTKIKKPVKVENLDEILEIIKSHNGSISPNDLWFATGKIDIEKFYILLKEGKFNGTITQKIQKIDGEIIDDSFILKT